METIYRNSMKNNKIKKRSKLFKSLPISDWHQIIAFEKIVRNYLKMKFYDRQNSNNAE